MARGMKANFDKIRGAERAAHLDAAERAEERISVFLAGPYINIAKTDRHKDNKSSDATKLRFKLYHALTELGYSVYLGEDVELRENGDKHYGAHANAVVYERHYIIKHTDAVIVLPSSPGSFCEIGDWAPAEEICKKMLLVIDQAHKRKVNYINSGIVRFAKKNGAEIEYHKYRSHDVVLETCTRFLDEIAATKRVRKLYGG